LTSIAAVEVVPSGRSPSSWTCTVEPGLATDATARAGTTEAGSSRSQSPPSANPPSGKHAARAATGTM